MASLLATWGVLIPTKVMEGRPLTGVSKRLLFLGVGGVLGLFALLTGDTEAGLPVVAALGLAFAAPNWWNMTSRDRPKRFSLWPVIVSGVIVALLSGLFGRALRAESLSVAWLTIVPIAAIIAQLVSPWNREAAAYSLAARRAGRSRIPA